ncbi:site-specific integrase [Pseudomonas sp. Irchel 3A7]|uniref:tyrosine-type recombinase/integrase n=1 Tax=Pseudomonas sp. Irchel 3A7 TaxID=2008913 RepID=UPI000BA2E128|nr:site-specific integrase [Pseudomonas sp. Irchel 3A7]
MSDIRKRTGNKGTTYQVRYPDKSSSTGYSYKTFRTRKEALAFREDSLSRPVTRRTSSGVETVEHAVKKWLDICEKEGLNGREPVTRYTLENYEYRANFITDYTWQKPLHELTPPDIVEFRSWLLRSDISRVLAGKVLSSLQSVMKEMSIRGYISNNCAAGVSIRNESRYDAPVVIPSKKDILELLKAADALSNAKNETISNAWQRYRPMLYLAVDSGMRPQEYLAAAQSALTDNGIQVDRAIEGDGSKISVTKTPAGRRFIELSPKTLEIVRHYAENLAVPNDYDLIFPDEKGRWQDRRNWQRRGFDVACEKAGLVIEEKQDDGEIIIRPKYRPYDLRHFYASMLIEKNINLKKIQKLMGHTNIETTLNVYGHLLDDGTGVSAKQDGMLSSLL